MKTNVLLINPKISSSSQSKIINKLINITFPTSLGVLAGYLAKSGNVDTRIVDEQIHPIRQDGQLSSLMCSSGKPRVVGISVLTLNCGRTYELAKRIKQIDPDVLTVLGGIHPTVLPEEALSKEGVDVVVRGEGEETFAELVNLFSENKDYSRIRGISYKRGGKYVHNPQRPLIGDLDAVPPFPYRMFEKDLPRYQNFAGIFSSRGCPYQCSFCSSRSISGVKYRHHSVGRIISEIGTLVRTYKQESVFFMDDNIAVDKKHFKELCAAIINEGLHKEAFFHGSLRGDNASEEILDTAHKANFRILYYGLETGSEALMRVINKNETVQEVVDAIARSHAKGFSVGATVIFGLPTETKKDRYETMRLVRKLFLESVRFNILSPYPGTPVFEREFPRKKVYIKNNWENFGVQYMWEGDDIPYVPDGNDRLELIFDTMFANLSYYLSIWGLRKIFKERYAGGNVIKLSERWYLSFSQIRKMASLFTYLGLRFTNVAIRMVSNRLRNVLVFN